MRILRVRKLVGNSIRLDPLEEKTNQEPGNITRSVVGLLAFVCLSTEIPRLLLLNV